MKETLGLFLETNCFLEIALPTVVHLILHPKDRIQFVNHVRVNFTPIACRSLTVYVTSGGFTSLLLMPHLCANNGG